MESTVPPRVEKLVVVGVGLIGGSAALALKRAGRVGRVVGVGRSPQNLATALALGVIDEASPDLADALIGADLVLIATPVGQTDAVFAALAPHLNETTLLTDAGSTKCNVVAAARALGRHAPRFVPAHPIAGAERSGAAAARADLFDGKNVILTPGPDTDPQAAAAVESVWAACGANVLRMAAAEHDAVFAAVSHLPHLLAYALVADLAGRANAAQLFAFAASGFRDFTRIAASPPEMWRDIALANRAALLAELDDYAAALDGLRTALAAGDGEALRALFGRASEARRRLFLG